MFHWTQSLELLDACGFAVAWAKTYDTPDAAWAACERGDWMLWLVGRTVAGDPWSDARRPLVACCVEIASQVLPIYEQRYPGDTRVRHCLDLFGRWASGEKVDRDALVDAQGKCCDAAAAADARSYAAAAYAAAAYADAATYAAVADPTQSLARSAEIVRKHFPSPPSVDAAREVKS